MVVRQVRYEQLSFWLNPVGAIFTVGFSLVPGAAQRERRIIAGQLPGKRQAGPVLRPRVHRLRRHVGRVLIPNQQAAGPLTSTVFFVLLFLSGLWFPLKSGSTLAQISSWFPIRHFITAVFRASNHPGRGPWAWHDLLTVVIWGAVAAVIALRRFQWSPRRA